MFIHLLSGIQAAQMGQLTEKIALFINYNIDHYNKDIKRYITLLRSMGRY